jgi:hypothetical protein
VQKWLPQRWIRLFFNIVLASLLYFEECSNLWCTSQRCTLLRSIKYIRRFLHYFMIRRQYLIKVVKIHCQVRVFKELHETSLRILLLFGIRIFCRRCVYGGDWRIWMVKFIYLSWIYYAYGRWIYLCCRVGYVIVRYIVEVCRSHIVVRK